jgi:hypothetical protein
LDHVSLLPLFASGSARWAAGGGGWRWVAVEDDYCRSHKSGL